MPLTLWLIFTTLVGACVGSFLNVVAFRLPAGQSFVHPPSTCPHCNTRLKWYDNVPVLAWFYLRGKCRSCHAPISFQYPAVEAATALIFGGWFYVCYMTSLRPDFSGAGLAQTWPVLIVYLVLFGVLIGSTLIDARLYIIPLSLPWLVTGVAAVVLPLAAMGLPQMIREQGTTLQHITKDLDIIQITQLRTFSPVPLASNVTSIAAIGGVLGLVIANLMLRWKLMPRSFDDPIPEAPEQAEQETKEEHAADTPSPDDWLAHPHPRKEMMKELAFVGLPVLGALVGWFIAERLGWAEADWPIALRVFGGVGLGYLAGGATVWATRIFGTLGFGKEAMGLGDVHLMAAVGAVVGWRAAVLAFFAAPFIGLTYVLIAYGLSQMLKREVKAIPYGPHLAAATVVVCVIYEPLSRHFSAVLGS